MLIVWCLLEKAPPYLRLIQADVLLSPDSPATSQVTFCWDQETPRKFPNASENHVRLTGPQSRQEGVLPIGRLPEDGQPPGSCFSQRSGSFI